MTSGGNRYPAKADLGAGQRQGCWSDLIAPVSVTEARTTNATVPDEQAEHSESARGDGSRDGGCQGDVEDLVEGRDLLLRAPVLHQEPNREDGAVQCPVAHVVDPMDPTVVGVEPGEDDRRAEQPPEGSCGEEPC